MTITLRQFQKYAEIEDPSEVDMVKCFLDKDIKEVNKMKDSEFAKQIELITEAINKKPVFSPTFEMGGVKYGFIPNLDDISYGENRDMTGYINEWSTMHLAMAVGYRPITIKKGGKYLIEDYNGTGDSGELMKDCPLDIVQGMNVFFYNLINDLLNCIPKFMTEEVVNLAALEASGQAIKKSTHYLREILLDLTK